MWWWRGRINRASYLVSLGLLLAIFAVLVAFQKRGSFIEIVLMMLAVPRLHDIGRSGWWVGGFLVAEMAIVAASFALLPLEAVPIPSGIFLFIVFGLMIWLGTISGQPEANRYGEPPAPGFFRVKWSGKSN